MKEHREQINSYWLDQKLADGPFTSAYRSSHSREPRLQAVTKFPLNHAPETLSLMVARLQICSSLGEQAGNRYIQECIFFQQSPLILQFRYASGASLAQKLLVGEALDVSFVIKALWEIAVALDYAHGRQIIHGNLKPENILFSEQQEVRLSDFTVPHPSFPYYPLVLRTLPSQYYAPEFREGRISPASDQYQLAHLAYEWLSGQLALRYGGKLQAYAPITTWPSWGEISPVFARATAPNEALRYPNTLAFAMELGRVCGVEPTRPLRNAPTPKRSSKTTLLRAVSILLLLVVLVSGGLLVGQTLKGHLNPAPTPTSRPIPTAEALYTARNYTGPAPLT